MTNDQQQVEAWQAEFDVWWNDTYLKTFGSMPNVVMLSYREVSFQAWMEAKRNQPVIELPEREWFVDGLEHKTIIKNDVIAAITAAGYSYRVKS